MTGRGAPSGPRSSRRHEFMNTEQAILTEVAEYYSGKLAAHGQTPRGVDWNGEESQTLRFAQLCKIIDDSAPFSLTDLGCGYGALLDFLRARFSVVRYHGYDVSAEMIDAATRALSDETLKMR